MSNGKKYDIREANINNIEGRLTNGRGMKATKKKL